MVSFDVESLFTDVPIDAALQAALQKLENDPDPAPLIPDQIANLLNFVNSILIKILTSIHFTEVSEKHTMHLRMRIEIHILNNRSIYEQ